MLSRPNTRRATRQNSAAFAVCVPWNLSTLRPSLPVKPPAASSRQHRFQVGGVAVPDAVGHDLVEAEAQLGGPAAQRLHELGIQERLAAGEAEDLDALGVGVLQEAQGDGDVEAVGPLDRHAAVRAAEVALIGPGEGEVVGAEGAVRRRTGRTSPRGPGGGGTGRDITTAPRKSIKRHCIAFDSLLMGPMGPMRPIGLIRP